MEGDTKLTDLIIGTAIQVHRALGLGLLESAYEACFAQLLTCLCLRDARVSLLLNFNTVRLTDGIPRVINAQAPRPPRFPSPAPPDNLALEEHLVDQRELPNPMTRCNLTEASCAPPQVSGVVLASAQDYGVHREISTRSPTSRCSTA